MRWLAGAAHRDASWECDRCLTLGLDTARNCWGAFGRPERPVVTLGPDLALHACPVSTVTPHSRSLWELFWACHTVVPAMEGRAVVTQFGWPRAGGVLDQPFRTLQAFGVIRAELAAMGEARDPLGPSSEGGARWPSVS